MSRNRAVRWAIWVTSCALAATTIAVAVKSMPLRTQPGAAAHLGRQAAALAQPPRAAIAQDPARAPLTMMARASRLPQEVARDTLRLNGVTVHSNGHCANRRFPSCTSLQGIRRGSLDGLLDFKRRSRCRIVVSGGTERGHAQGRFSHWNGYKIDILPNRCVDRYVTQRFRHVGIRGDGAELYREPSGVLYADEGSHWDVLYK